MRKYQITITMEDGSQGMHQGLYESGCSAVIATMQNFPEARRIAARRLA